MSDSNPKDGGTGPNTPTSPLTKEQRRDLLAQIERAASRSEQPEAALERANEELRAGRLDAARRLLEQLEARAPELAGLDLFRRRLADAEARAKYEEKRRTAEEMLLRYIQQRNKPGAQLALETLLEIVPEHPFRGDYKIWIADLDQEMALQKRLEAELDAGRSALLAGDFEGARRQLEALRNIDLDATATAGFAREVEEIERGREESAETARQRQRFEELVAKLDLEGAERALDALGTSSIPKVTLDFLRKRLEEARDLAQARSDLRGLEQTFREHLAAERWQEARDLAREAGQRFRGNPRATELFDEVTRHEAVARRRQSVEQGVRALEGYISNGQRQEAELALKLLQGLDLAPQRLAEYEAKIKNL